MGVPKRKTSKMRLRQRKAANRWIAPGLSVDKETGELVRAHHINPKTGRYNGRQVISKTVEA